MDIANPEYVREECSVDLYKGTHCKYSKFKGNTKSCQMADFKKYIHIYVYNSLILFPEYLQKESSIYYFCNIYKTR